MGKGANWSVGSAYEPFVGRWSRLIAPQFVEWLSVEPESAWLDVGCGTGALCGAILDNAQPRTVVGIDPSEGFLSHARSTIIDGRAEFHIGNAMSLPFDDAAFDAVVSGLVLNFVPEESTAVAEMRRVARPGGHVGSYIWDYVDGMQMLRIFWEAAVELDPTVADKAEARRFPLCNPDALASLFNRAGLTAVEVRAIEVNSHFHDFDDFWTPFLGGQGPAAGHVMSLTEDKRTEMRDYLRQKLPVADDGSITLLARAWAAKGRV